MLPLDGSPLLELDDDEDEELLLLDDEEEVLLLDDEEEEDDEEVEDDWLLGVDGDDLDEDDCELEGDDGDGMEDCWVCMVSQAVNSNRPIPASVWITYLNACMAVVPPGYYS